MDNDANVNVSGNWNVAGSVEIEAVQTDRSNVNADAVRGGAATFSGTTAKNDIKGDTSVALGGNITANDVKVLAKTTSKRVMRTRMRQKVTTTVQSIFKAM